MTNGVVSSAFTETIGMALGAATYGVVLSLATNCIHLLLLSKTMLNRWRLIIYVSWILFLATAILALQIRYTQVLLFSQLSNERQIVNAIDNALTFLQHWSTEGVVLYRFHVIYASRINVVIVPSLLYAACVGIGCTYVVILIVDDAVHTLQSLMKAYLSIAGVLHIFLQLAVIWRILRFRRLFKRINSNQSTASGHNDVYTSIAALLVESASLDTGAVAIYLVTFAINNSSTDVFAYILEQVLAIPPLLIIMRVANGHGWSKDTSRRMTAEIGDSRMEYADRTTGASAASGTIV